MFFVVKHPRRTPNGSITREDTIAGIVEIELQYVIQRSMNVKGRGIVVVKTSFLVESSAP